MNRAKSIGSAIAVVVLVLQGFCTARGIAFDQSFVTEMASYAVACVGLFWGIWKNHNFTDTAAKIQEVLEYAKATSLGEALGIKEDIEDAEDDNAEEEGDK